MAKKSPADRFGQRFNLRPSAITNLRKTANEADAAAKATSQQTAGPGPAPLMEPGAGSVAKASGASAAEDMSLAAFFGGSVADTPVSDTPASGGPSKAKKAATAGKKTAAKAPAKTGGQTDPDTPSVGGSQRGKAHRSNPSSPGKPASERSRPTGTVHNKRRENIFSQVPVAQYDCMKARIPRFISKALKRKAAAHGQSKADRFRALIAEDRRRLEGSIEDSMGLGLSTTGSVRIIEIPSHVRAAMLDKSGIAVDEMVHISLFVTSSDRAFILERAEEHGVSVNEFICRLITFDVTRDE